MSSTINAGTSGLVLTGSTTTTLSLATNGTTRATIDASGNLAVGTGNLTFSSTGQRITGDFSNATQSNRLAFQTSTTNGATDIYAIPNGTGFVGAFTAVNASDPNNASSAIFGAFADSVRLYSNRNGTGTFYPMTFYTGGSERMRLDTSGNVGIGTASPLAKLHINSSTNTSASFFIQNQGTNVLVLSNEASWLGSGSSNNAVLASYSTNSLLFGTNAAERMRITSGGDVLIGTTTSGNGRLEVSQSANNEDVARFFSAGSGDVGQRAILVSKYDNNSTTSQIFVQFAINNNATTSGQINANGANAVAFGTWSDARLKENIVDLPPQLASICALRPVEFDYKTGGHQIGFIAQEMQTIYPDVVGENADKMLTVTGWSKTEARLVKAIQELAAKVAALEAR